VRRASGAPCTWRAMRMYYSENCGPPGGRRLDALGRNGAPVTAWPTGTRDACWASCALRCLNCSWLMLRAGRWAARARSGAARHASSVDGVRQARAIKRRKTERGGRAGAARPAGGAGDDAAAEADRVGALLQLHAPALHAAAAPILRPLHRQARASLTAPALALAPLPPRHARVAASRTSRRIPHELNE